MSCRHGGIVEDGEGEAVSGGRWATGGSCLGGARFGLIDAITSARGWRWQPNQVYVAKRPLVDLLYVLKSVRRVFRLFRSVFPRRFIIPLLQKLKLDPFLQRPLRRVRATR